MDELTRSLRQISVPRLAKKGSNILFQGEVPRKGYLIQDGIVRAYTITSLGEERIVAFYGKGDLLPLSWLLGETSNTLFYYDAVSDTRLLGFSRDDYKEIVSNDIKLLNALLVFLGNQYTALLLRITGLEQSRAVEKIGFTLYYLLFRYGNEKKPGMYSVEIKLSQLMIANLVGLTRESTTKNLKILKDKGIIEYNHLTYIIDKAKLENYIGEDSFRDLNVN